MSKVKLSNRRILEDRDILAEISRKQLPIKVSYAVAKNLSKINHELKIYDEERKKLIDKYAEKDEKGKVLADKKGQVQFRDKAGWDKDINELMDIENEVEIHTFSMDLLNNFNISPGELMAMDYMIEE